MDDDSEEGEEEDGMKRRKMGMKRECRGGQ